jgi:alpha-tubulin suppressor-like RCC1 family protein
MNNTIKKLTLLTLLAALSGCALLDGLTNTPDPDSPPSPAEMGTSPDLDQPDSPQDMPEGPDLAQDMPTDPPDLQEPLDSSPDLLEPDLQEPLDSSPDLQETEDMSVLQDMPDPEDMSEPDIAGPDMPEADMPDARPRVLQLSAGLSHTCALLKDGSIWCWGRSDTGALGIGSPAQQLTTTAQRINSTRTFQAISTNHRHTCAIADDATLHCWGINDYGQLGFDSGATLLHPSPVQIMALPSVRSVAAADQHTCVVLLNGSISCWGDNAVGSLGDGTLSSRKAHDINQLVTLAPPVRLDSQRLHTCAHTSRPQDSDRVFCWGSNISLRIDDNAAQPRYSSPRARSFAADVLDVATGAEHTCALISLNPSTTQIHCWGNNDKAQASGSTSAPSTVGAPRVIDPSSFPHAPKKLALGFYHSCVLAEDGAVGCWGSNDMGQLGRSGNTPNLTKINLLPGPAHEIAAGNSHACAAVADSVFCWGQGTSGELGNGSMQHSSHPVEVIGLPTL